MANSEKGLLFFYDWRVPFQELSGDECKALLLAMLDYSQNDIEPPAFEGSAKIAASFLFPALMRSKQCAKAGRTGGLSTASGGASGTASSTASGAASSEIQAQDKTKTRQNKTRQDETETKQDETETKQDNLTEQRFSAFWEAYPKKQAREDAKKAFLEIAPDESTLDAILAAIERQKGRCLSKYSFSWFPPCFGSVEVMYKWGKYPVFICIIPQKKALVLHCPNKGQKNFERVLNPPFGGKLLTLMLTLSDPYIYP